MIIVIYTHICVYTYIYNYINIVIIVIQKDQSSVNLECIIL